MKANRKFKEEKEAVSAVIGVILMVAITVAIAATVFVYVNQLADTGGGAGKTISATFDSKNEDDYYVTFKVTSADAGIAWSDVSAKWKDMGGNADGSNVTTSDGSTDQTGNIEVGDYFSIWVESAGTYDIDLLYNEDIIWTCPTVTLS